MKKTNFHFFHFKILLILNSEKFNRATEKFLLTTSRATVHFSLNVRATDHFSLNARGTDPFSLNARASDHFSLNARASDLYPLQSKIYSIPISDDCQSRYLDGVTCLIEIHFAWQHDARHC